MRKKILITGRNSFVGLNFIRWVSRWPNRYEIEAVSIREGKWEKIDFSQYDAILHVAGVVHKKESRKNSQIYYTVNRDLAYKVANKAKSEGVKQFIFLSSMSIYGIYSGIINKDTKPNPITYYGKSKLQAEELILSLASQNFRVAIIRPPMIYGKGCKGNYRRLSNFAKKIPVFPDIINQRSMIFIDNLCEFIRLIIDNLEEGIFFPQNDEYVCTSKLVKLIANENRKKVRLSKIFNPLLLILGKNLRQKVFGNLIYEKELSLYKEQYCIYSLEESIKLTEVKQWEL